MVKYYLSDWFYLLLNIGVAGSFSEGGQPFRPAKIQSFPATIFSCQGGASSSILSCQVTVLSFSAKLSCQYANMAGEWLKNRQKWKKNIKILQKPSKSGRKQTKMTGKLAKCGVLQIIICQALISVLPSSHFCPAKLPFLSCQALISVLPRSHFCPAKITNFSRGGQGPLGPPPCYAYE